METSLSVVAIILSAGALLVSYLSYQRVRHVKALDLRMEAHRARNDAHIAFVQLVELREHCIKSRKAVASATGRFHSGAMQMWQSQWDSDQKRIEELSHEIPKADVNYDSVSPKELESIIVGLHRTNGWINDIKSRYESDLATDDEDRKQIREDIRVKMASDLRR